MKKTFFTSILITICLIACFASGNSEKNKQINIAVMSGPTGFSSCALDEDMNVKIYPSPAEAVANLLNGTVDMAVLPANKAAALYNSGAQIKAVAVVGEGMLSILGTDENSQVLNVPSPGDTPDIMAGLLFPEYKREYGITAPAQLAQMLIAGKVKLAILPQPFVNMVLAKNKNAKIIADVQQKWAEKTGVTQFPMSVLVTSGKFAEDNQKLLKKVEKSYKDSVEFVIANPDEASEKIEELGIMAKELARSAIADCNLTFKNGNEAEKELKKYYSILKGIMPQAIGGKEPDSNFYY